MIKDPNEPIDLGDILPLPQDFGKAPPKVLPFPPLPASNVPPNVAQGSNASFGKRPTGAATVGPGWAPLSSTGVIEYKLTDEEVISLRTYLDEKTTTLLYADLKGAPIPPDEDTPLNMLKGLIKDIEQGKVKPVSMFIGMIEFKQDDSEDYPFYVTGLSRLALRGLLHEYLENLP